MIKLFSKNGATMPLPTQVLVDMSGVAQHYGLYIAAFLAIVFIFFTSYIRQPAGRRWWDEAKLTFPLIGPAAGRFVSTRNSARSWPTCCKTACRF